MSKNPWINPASHGGQTKQGQDAYDKSKGIVRTATGRGVEHRNPMPSRAAQPGVRQAPLTRPPSAKQATANADIASANANKATAKANRTGDMSHHGAAQDLHMEASQAHKAAGNEEAAKAHWQAAQGHQKAVMEGGKVAPVGGAPALQTGAKGGSFYVTATGRKVYKKQ